MNFTVSYELPDNVAEILQQNWNNIARINLEDIAAIKIMPYNEINDQLSFHTKKALKCLTFLEVLTLCRKGGRLELNLAQIPIPLRRTN